MTNAKRANKTHIFRHYHLPTKGWKVLTGRYHRHVTSNPYVQDYLKILSYERTRKMKLDLQDNINHQTY